MPKIKKKKIQMHIAQRKELDVHKTKQKKDKNRTTTSLVLDSSMQSGRWEFRQNQRIWLRLRAAEYLFSRYFLFHALTFAGSRGCCLNTRPIGRVFKHLPRDPASVNAMKQTCVIVILAYFTLLQPNSHGKRC